MKKTKFPAFRFSPLAACLLLLPSLHAAPAAKGPSYEPVAEGYCAWAGLTPANFMYGRDLCPSDLRQKLTLVVFIDAAKFEDHLQTICPTVKPWNPNVNGMAIESGGIPRNTICLVVFVGREIPDAKALNACFKKNTEDFAGVSWYFYANVTGAKVPEHDKLPFYCVFGPEPGDPLASGVWDDGTKKKVSSFRGNKKYVLDWKPYCGTIEEPTAVKGFAKTLASGKPLDTTLIPACRKGISNKDPEKAKECQILYDALEQTRSDMIFSVVSFASSCPPRAAYEAQLLIKKFPRSKKKLQPVLERIKGIPDADKLCKFYTQLRIWGSDDFKCKNAGEAKKIADQLLKMKAVCDSLVQKSGSTVIQSAAAWIASEAESLAPQMESKVPVK